MRLGVVTGLPMESRVLLPYCSAHLLVRAAGLMPGAARRAAEQLIAEGATALMSFGLAGGLDPTAAAGTALVASEVRGDTWLATDGIWRDRIADLVTADFFGAIADTPVVLVNPDLKAFAFERTSAAVADMESYAVAQVAAERRVPFAALRVIADTADDVVPPIALKAISPDGRPLIGKAILGALMNPSQIPDLIRLGQRTSLAMKRLETLARLGEPTAFGLA